MKSKFIVISTNPIENSDSEVLINVEKISSVGKAANGVLVKLNNGSFYLDISHGFNDYKEILGA